MDLCTWGSDILPQWMIQGALGPPSQKRGHHANRRRFSVRVLQGREIDRRVREDQPALL